MPTHTSAQDGDRRDLLDLYNAFMFDIEPELMTDMIPLHEHWYAQETEEERGWRTRRYLEAFEECARRMEAVMHLWKESIGDVRDCLLVQAKSAGMDDDSDVILSLQSVFQTAA